MNKSAIQKFAMWARNELIAQVSQRAYQYGIEEDNIQNGLAETLGGRILSAEERIQRQELIQQIREKGYRQVMEEVAYTWFNRFIALRFMEVNNYLPSHIRVFSDASGAFKPEILNDVLHVDLSGLDLEKVETYVENNDTEALYRYLLLVQCNALNKPLPAMFERMGSYTEMLLPNNILRQESVIGHMVLDIPEEDWLDQVQIIGWLYQYYNTELKNDTFADLKKILRSPKNVFQRQHSCLLQIGLCVIWWKILLDAFGWKGIPMLNYEIIGNTIWMKQNKSQKLKCSLLKSEKITNASDQKK